MHSFVWSFQRNVLENDQWPGAIFNLELQATHEAILVVIRPNLNHGYSFNLVRGVSIVIPCIGGMELWLCFLLLIGLEDYW